MASEYRTGVCARQGLPVYLEDRTTWLAEAGKATNPFPSEVNASPWIHLRPHPPVAGQESRQS